MSGSRFEVILDPDALKEYNKLDNSVVVFLAGCKEIKLKNIGIRIVFRITNEKVDVLRVAYILTVEKRSDDFVFKIAHKRYKFLKALSKPSLVEYLKRQLNWRNREKK